MFALLLVTAGIKLSTSVWQTKAQSLISFAFYQPSLHLAWRPDTSLVDSNLVARNLPEQFFSKSESQVLLAWISPKITYSEPPDIRFKLPMTNQLDATLTWLTKDKKHWIAALAAPKGQPSQQDLAVGIAEGPWQNLSTVSFQSNGKAIKVSKESGLHIQATVVPDPQSASGLPMTTLQLHLPETALGSSLQLASRFNKESIVRQPIPVASLDAQHSIRLSLSGDIRNLKEIRLEGRIYEWHTIRAAHFRPK